MTWHISIGTLILALIVARFLWRLTHPVAPESSLPPWQRITSEAVHRLLYLLVLLTTLSGWLFASAHGWSVSWFFIAPLPMPTSGNRGLVKLLDGWHQNFMWALLVVAGLHIVTLFIHLFYYHDGVMRRMLPGKAPIRAVAKPDGPASGRRRNTRSRRSIST
jgi:cytochrome b561